MELGARMAGVQPGSPPGKQVSGALSVDGSGALVCLMLHCPSSPEVPLNPDRRKVSLDGRIAGRGGRLWTMIPVRELRHIESEG